MSVYEKLVWNDISEKFGNKGSFTTVVRLYARELRVTTDFLAKGLRGLEKRGLIQKKKTLRKKGLLFVTYVIN